MSFVTDCHAVVMKAFASGSDGIKRESSRRSPRGPRPVRSDSTAPPRRFPNDFVSTMLARKFLYLCSGLRDDSPPQRSLNAACRFRLSL
jgi:hypothetical protein